MSLFKPATNSMAFLKAGFMGEAGAGKTHTAVLVTIGLIKFLRARKVPGSDKPVFFLDTEQGAAWVKPMFDEAGIELMVSHTRAFSDLVAAVREAEANGSALIIDSITHFWEELQATHKRKKAQQFRREDYELQFQDWSVLKGLWRQFSDTFVNSQLHCVLCGRLGFEYENTEDERGRRQIEKSGVKMAAEKGLGYEPNILVWMERRTDLHTKTVERTAVILKDRSQHLDGGQFPNPTFQTFLPHIQFLALGGRHEAVDTTRTSDDLIPMDDYVPMHDRKAIQRDIVIEELDALLLEHGAGGTSSDAKAKRLELIKKHFNGITARTEIEKVMPLVDLQASFDSLHRELTGKPSRYGVQDSTPEPLNDAIPDFYPPGSAGAPAAPAAVTAPAQVPAKPDPVVPAERSQAELDQLALDKDRDAVVARITAALAKAPNLTRLTAVVRDTQADVEALDDTRRDRVIAAHRAAKEKLAAAKQASNRRPAVRAGSHAVSPMI